MEKKYGNITFLPLGIFLKQESALVIADLHIGFEKLLQRQGMTLPRSSYPEMREMVKEYIALTKAKTIILAGDVKEDFGRLSFQEFYEMIDFLLLLEELELKVIVVRGNHDNYLLPFLKERKVECYEEFYILGEYFITHGHIPIKDAFVDSNAQTIIFGHEHPSILVRDEVGGGNKYKAIITGNIYDKKLIVLPSFSPLKPGTELNVEKQQKFLSPILKDSDYESLKAHVYEGGWYSFVIKDILLGVR